MAFGVQLSAVGFLRLREKGLKVNEFMSKKFSFEKMNSILVENFSKAFSTPHH
jgi:hypothetical protein